MNMLLLKLYLKINIMRRIDEIIVHWSDSHYGDVDSIRYYHVKHNKWKDIGYHFVITRDCVVQPGRSLDVVGAHCLKHNSNSIGICVIGCKDYPPDQYQLHELGMLIGALKLIFGDLKVSVHSDYAPTECPGDDLRRYVHDLNSCFLKS